MGATIKAIDEKKLRSDLPAFEVGDIVKMKVRVQEADKTRLHPFEGTVIRKTGRGLKATFTVRKISFGEGVERVFPIHSPVIESLEVVSKGVVKRAKLYYLRERVGKKARVKRQQMQ
ncbi:MAG: 50S ribosomal protein L19 [Candidatus Omnitrophica bacterium]|nr:50S ribosomal protein L19 [Candidatus Omnitrophota bacterium]